MLHFLSDEAEFETAVRRMQGATAPDGLNVICVYTNKSQPDLRPFLIDAENLKRLYEDWEMLHFEETPGTDEIVDGPDHGKKIVRIYLIARKL